MNTGYAINLWEEIKRNDPVTAKFIRDMHDNFGSTLHTFQWLREPQFVCCTIYRPEIEHS